jgi:hypothetical protein
MGRVSGSTMPVAMSYGLCRKERLSFGTFGTFLASRKSFGLIHAVARHPGLAVSIAGFGMFRLVSSMGGKSFLSVKIRGT